MLTILSSKSSRNIAISVLNLFSVMFFFGFMASYKDLLSVHISVGICFTPLNTNFEISSDMYIPSSIASERANVSVVKELLRGHTEMTSPWSGVWPVLDGM